MSRYNAHHILRELKLEISEELSAIAKTNEVFISFSVNNPLGSYRKKYCETVKVFQSMRFLDRYQFVFQSLENLAKTLKTGDFLLLKEFSNILDQLFCELTQKGFFPYSFLESFAKFEDPLPALGDCGENCLTGKVDITLHYYQHAPDIYREFVCTNLGDNHGGYLKVDKLLADIFEKFRSVCLSVYKLDLALLTSEL